MPMKARPIKAKIQKTYLISWVFSMFEIEYTNAFKKDLKALQKGAYPCPI